MQSISFTPLEIQATREYWTAERIANAAPAPFLGMNMPEGRQQKYDEFSQAETEIAFCASGQIAPQGRANVNDLPFKKAGRLYYVTKNGHNLYATAQFVGADNILMTAARCLKNEFSERKNEGWSTNMLFQRAYQDGHSPQNTDMLVGSAYVPQGWGFGNGFDMVKHSYGFIKTVDRSQVGFLTLPRYFAMPNKMTAIGYTKNHGNNEEFMYKIYGTKGESKDGAIPLIGNDMDYGSIGGAWFKEKANARCNTIYGMNIWRDSDSKVFGPLLNWRTIDEVNKMNDTAQSYLTQNIPLPDPMQHEALLNAVQNEALPELSAADVDDYFASLQK